MLKVFTVNYDYIINGIFRWLLITSWVGVDWVQKISKDSFYLSKYAAYLFKNF